MKKNTERRNKRETKKEVPFNNSIADVKQLKFRRLTDRYTLHSHKRILTHTHTQKKSPIHMFQPLKNCV